MNKQIISTIIIWLFILPLIWFIHSTKITKNTSLQKIEGIISKVECKKKHKRLNGELYIYYDNGKKYISYQNEYLNSEHFNNGCQKLSQIAKVNSSFTAIKSMNIDKKLISLVINSKVLLAQDAEILKNNKNCDKMIIIIFIMGGVLTLGNVIIWFYKLNPDNWVKSSFFQYVLYFIAVMAIIRYIFDL